MTCEIHESKKNFIKLLVKLMVNKNGKAPRINI